MNFHIFCFSVHCPTCGKMVEWNKKNLFRPFCRKRCKLIDFGKWIENPSNSTKQRAMC